MTKIDVIVPIHYYNKDKLPSNIESWFREVPINHLIVGFGENNGNILWQFEPFQTKMVTVDQSMFNTLGYCIYDLAHRVETEWFLYLHNDVYLPSEWFLKMEDYMSELDFIESPRSNNPAQYANARAYSGAQLIKTEIFNSFIIEDDYIYNAEDIIFQHLTIKNGYRYGKVPVFHTHYSTGERLMGRAEILDFQKKALLKYRGYI